MRAKNIKRKSREAVKAAKKGKRMGPACRLEDCCREVRIMFGQLRLGQITSGYNTITNEVDTYIVLKVHKTDPNKDVLQKILSNE